MLSLYGREAHYTKLMPSSVLRVYLVSKQTTLSILLRILIPDTRPDTKPENFTEILRNIVRMREQIVPGRFFLPRKKWPGNEARVIVTSGVIDPAVTRSALEMSGCGRPVMTFAQRVIVTSGVNR